MDQPLHQTDTTFTDEQVAAALNSLTGAERVLFRRLIVRQLRNQRTAPKLLSRYGVEGTARLASARSLWAWAYIPGILSVAFSAAGMAEVAIPMWILLLLICAIGMSRTMTATKAGKRWRASLKGRRSV